MIDAGVCVCQLKTKQLHIEHCYYITSCCCCLWKSLIKILNMVYRHRYKHKIW
nr:MAG TPA: hypothetical protein [Caudoviricetes sp.]